MNRRRVGAASAALGLGLAIGCGLLPGAGPWDAPPPPPYQPDRQDYATFRAAWPDLHEPNYLPFMAHQLSLGAGKHDALVFCRWDDADMPLTVHVDAPVIDDALQDEFTPRDPASYVAAVDHALATWEREMEGLVRFQRVDDPKAARIHIVLHGESAPVVDEERQVLGSTSLGHSCSVEGWDPDAERLRVRFRVDALQIYVADEFGLLAPDQVEWVALHELGHALGMRGHSPIPADLMYEVVRDRVLVREGLSTEDTNSFLALYSLPNGSVFTEIDSAYGASHAEAPPPTGPPMLALAPHVDPTHGFRLRVPYGWLRVETEQGVAAVDGVTWDYSASYQVVANRQPSIEAYLERYGAWYTRRGRLLRVETLVVNGHRAVQGVLARADNQSIEEVTLIESGDGRVIVVTAECAPQAYEAYGAWFDAALATLEIEPSEAR